MHTKTKKAGYIFRIDDVTPWMNRDNFLRLEKIFDTYNIKPIIGLVPDNQDRQLWLAEYTAEFWEKMRSLEEKWRIIAQHGYQHLYTTHNSGIIALNNYSEFAWLPYQEQYEKIKKGKEILEKHLKKEIKWRMAPAHSFDENTCKVLKELEFEYITDGIALSPFSREGLKWLPQQLRKPIKKRNGIWTICLHPNSYSPAFIDNIEAFCKAESQHCINTIESLDYSPQRKKSSFPYRFYAEQKLYRWLLQIKNLITFPYRKSKECGSFLTRLKGWARYLRHYLAYKKHHFDRWHILPAEWRPYTTYVAEIINSDDKSRKGTVLEIWCWLGEILSKIKSPNKYGFDTAPEVINAAKKLYPSSNYSVGSFDTIKWYKIDYLITVNFIHAIPPEELKSYYATLCRDNTIKTIIVDELHNNNNYRFNHNFSEILPSDYVCIKSSPYFVGNRKIVVFSKKEK